MIHLKNKIKKKFGTIRRFCQTNGLNYTRVINILNERVKNPTYLSDMKFLISNTNPKHRDDIIYAKDSERARTLLFLNWKSATSFCSKHKQFHPVFISHVLNGKKKRKDKRFNDLMKVLEKGSYKLQS